MNNSLVSVIIVNWNGARDLPACLTALQQQTYTPLEIIIVENASTDKSRQVIDDYCVQAAPRPNVRVMYNQQNVGFCRGNNQGIRAAGGEFVLLLNADVVVEPPFIAQLVALMQADSGVGIALGKLLKGDDPSLLDSTGIAIRKTRRAVDRGQGEPDRGQYDRVEEVFGASGAACLYRRTMLDAIKYSAAALGTAADEYLDELFFAYKEDIDLAWRARLAGWKCVYTPAAGGRHYRQWGAGNRRAIPRWIRRHSLKNRYLMLFKNECGPTLRPHLGSVALYEAGSLGYVLLREPHLFAAAADLIRLWPQIVQKRRLTQAMRASRATIETLKTWFQ